MVLPFKYPWQVQVVRFDGSEQLQLTAHSLRIRKLPHPLQNGCLNQ